MSPELAADVLVFTTIPVLLLKNEEQFLILEDLAT